jgi:hypothetical protein
VLFNFYPKAAAFLAQNNLDIGYASWIYTQTRLKDPRLFNEMYYKLFFAEDKAEIYKTTVKPAARPPPDVVCPVCGTHHEALCGPCPACGLPPRPSPQDVILFRKLQEFPPEKRADYFHRQDGIFTEYGADFLKINSLIDGLNREFGMDISG